MKYSSEHFEITKRFWSGTKDGKSLSIEDEKCRIVAINRAINDLMARTLTPTGAEGKFRTAVIDPLRNKLDEWFQRPEENVSEESFDTWHNESCEVVLEFLNKYYSNDKEGKASVQYGKAQKIVNMTMKGLYCLKGADAYEKHFKYCHIALDSFTLEWCQRNILTPQENARAYLASMLRSWSAPERFRKYSQHGTLSEDDAKKELDLRWVIEHWDDKRAKLDGLLEEYDQWRKVMNTNKAKGLWREKLTQLTEGWLPPKFIKGKVSNWSLIPDNASASFYSYGQYVSWIRAYFAGRDPYAGLTPFQAEFYIWPEIQLELAAEAFYGQDIGKEKVIDEAHEKWETQWNADDVDKKDFDDRFKWCKDRFKELPLDQKIEYLRKRVESLTCLLSDTQSSYQEALQ